MNLDELVKQRTSKKNESFPIAEKELCDRYEKVTTPMVNDVLREMQYLYQTFPTNILPLREEMKVCGVAFTIKGSKNLSLEDEMVEEQKCWRQYRMTVLLCGIRLRITNLHNGAKL